VNPVRAVARPLLAGIFVYSASTQLRDASYVEQGAAAASLPDPKLAARLHVGGNLVGGLALATGRLPRLAALGLAVNLIPTTYAGHAFWKAEPEQKQLQKINFFKNLSVLGGLLLAILDTGGRESVPHRISRVSGRSARKAEQASRRAAHRAAELPAQVVDAVSDKLPG
jgi:uncharacterized membrane protein YphA (DoxX/SURF4 family)